MNNDDIILLIFFAFFCPLFAVYLYYENRLMDWMLAEPSKEARRLPKRSNGDVVGRMSRNFELRKEGKLL